jgi:hypothetical protein
MNLVMSLFRWEAPERADAGPAPPRPASHDWPLMGDIVSSRGGVPEHLIRWRRAEGGPDPDPQP